MLDNTYVNNVFMNLVSTWTRC